MNARSVLDLARGRRTALFLDADNFPAGAVGAVFERLSIGGSIDVRRAYGDWSTEILQPWRALLSAHAISPVQTFAVTRGKNAADIALVIDAMDLIRERRFDAVAIASSDSDFTPLASRLRADGLEVIGFGEAKTPAPFVSACTAFHRIAPTAEVTKAPKSVAKPIAAKGNGLGAALRAAYDGVAGTDGWASMGAVGHAVRNGGILDPRAHGAKSYSALVRGSGLFVVETRQDGQPWIRAAKKA